MFLQGGACGDGYFLDEAGEMERFVGRIGELSRCDLEVKVIHHNDSIIRA